MTAPVPARLDIDVDPLEVCRQYDVFLDDVKQTVCTVADVADGFVKRYKKSVFGLLIHDKHKRLIVETVRGTVRIERKQHEAG